MQSRCMVLSCMNPRMQNIVSAQESTLKRMLQDMIVFISQYLQSIALGNRVWIWKEMARVSLGYCRTKEATASQRPECERVGRARSVGCAPREDMETYLYMHLYTHTHTHSIQATTISLNYFYNFNEYEIFVGLSSHKVLPNTLFLP